MIQFQPNLVSVRGIKGSTLLTWKLLLSFKYVWNWFSCSIFWHFPKHKQTHTYNTQPEISHLTLIYFVFISIRLNVKSFYLTLTSPKSQKNENWKWWTKRWKNKGKKWKWNRIIDFIFMVQFDVHCVMKIANIVFLYTRFY